MLLGDLRVDGVKRGASPGANDKASSKYSLDGKSTHYAGRFLWLFSIPSVLLDASGKLEVFAERSEIWPVHVQWPSKLKLRWTRCPAVLV